MKHLLFLLLISPIATLYAQQPIDSVNLMKDIKTLSSDAYEGRATGTKGNRQAQLYIIDRFRQVGIQPYNGTYEYSFFFQQGTKRIMGTNLYGYIQGKSDSVYVISAHFDHLGNTGWANGADSIYNGADDNASGVGGLLAIADYYRRNKPSHTLVFAAFDAEEVGLRGAAAFVNAFPVPAAKVRLNLNMDMVSHNSRNELYVCGTYPYPNLKPFVTQAAALSQVKLLTGHDRPTDGSQNWTSQSDHYEFHKKRIPFLYFGVEDHADYHRLTDEFSRITPSFYYRAVQGVLNTLQVLDAQRL